MNNKLLAFLFVLVFLFGCTSEPATKNEILYKGIDFAPVPDNCADKQDNACELFACMADQCWCRQGPEMIVLDGFTSLQTEEEIKDYFEEKRDEITGTSQLEVTKAVKLNSVFWNVFFETENGEQVLTVAADGTVIETVCGV
ncbi:MAG: hypothetical protein COT90_00845 [Candidatus Diapherotrites archaeon CG10_big_fil_rev_8_21_14_0_10_31_34]|nr:MAG: hypothetical protein COT90_00845 [Candidatus Diapherotrites archaeon CG10_big_fil_rev_8_21_14_0_10_31_34]